MVAAAAHEAAGFGAHLRLILAHPEMVALLAASDQAGRLLRPVCRMLGVEIDLLRPGVAGQDAPCQAAMRPERADPVTAPTAKRGLRAKPVAEPYRIPLPRGVLAAARRQGFARRS
jgi:hypothetical protein